VVVRAQFNLGTPNVCLPFLIDDRSKQPVSSTELLVNRTSELVFNVLWSYVEEITAFV
jgi:hypothetical protein